MGIEGRIRLTLDAIDMGRSMELARRKRELEKNDDANKTESQEESEPSSD